MVAATKVTGVVLAGGRSRRFGSDKTELELDGRSLVERAAERLAASTRAVLVADRGRGLVVEHPSIDDGPGEGPVAGILGAARWAPGSALLVLACDLPLVPASLLAALAGSETGDWVVPRWGHRLEPLCALYRRPALEALASNVERDVLAPQRLIAHPELDVRLLEGEALAEHGSPEEMFANVNRREDLERVNRLLGTD